jgi:hypothetical protein
MVYFKFLRIHLEGSRTYASQLREICDLHLNRALRREVETANTEHTLIFASLIQFTESNFLNVIFRRSVSEANPPSVILEKKNLREALLLNLFYIKH